MGPALLDINVLIALLDQGHLLHRPATPWLEGQLEHGWATCPITENGVVRIMAQPAYPCATGGPGGRCASFDQRISLDLVPGAEAHQLRLIPSS